MKLSVVNYVLFSSLLKTFKKEEGKKLYRRYCYIITIEQLGLYINVYVTPHEYEVYYFSQLKFLWIFTFAFSVSLLFLLPSFSFNSFLQSKEESKIILKTRARGGLLIISQVTCFLYYSYLLNPKKKERMAYFLFRS